MSEPERYIREIRRLYQSSRCTLEGNNDDGLGPMGDGVQEYHMTKYYV